MGVNVKRATWQEWAIMVGLVLVGIIGTIVTLADYVGRV